MSAAAPSQQSSTGASQAATPNLFAMLRPVILIAVAAGALAYLVCSLITPRYSAEALVALTAKAPARVSEEVLQRQVRAVSAPELAAAVAAELKLADKPELNGTQAPGALAALLRVVGLGGAEPAGTGPDRVRAALTQRLLVTALPEARQLSIRFAASDPELAAAAANGFANAYLKTLLKQPEPPPAPLADTAGLASEAKARLDAMTGDLAGLEAEIAALRKDAADKAQAVAKAQASAGDQRVADLAADLAKAKATRADADLRLRAVRDQIKAGSFDAIAELQRSASVQTLLQERARLERQITELSATLLPEHPRMQQLNAKLAGFKRELTVAASKIVEGLEREAKLAAAREEAARKAVDEAKARAAAPPAQDTTKLQQAEAAAAAKRAEIDAAKAAMATAAAAASQPAVEAPAKSVAALEGLLVAPAAAANLTPSPDKTFVSAAAAIAALLAGLVVVLVKRALSLLRPAAAPTADKAAERPASAKTAATPPRLASSAARASEAARAGAMLNEIAHRLADWPPQDIGIRTIVASAGDDFAPAAEALALARRLAADGAAVVLVDWSPTGEGIASALGIRPAPGFNDMLVGGATFEDVMRRMKPGKELHAIAAGSDLTLSVESLDADVLNLVLDALDEAYDHIVVAARHSEAQMLFETILGRFDAGVLVGDADGEAEGTFLGFEVTDIEIMHCPHLPETAIAMADAPQEAPIVDDQAEKAAASSAAAVARALRAAKPKPAAAVL